jgi:hypothetical protein
MEVTALPPSFDLLKIRKLVHASLSNLENENEDRRSGKEPHPSGSYLAKAKH